MIGKKIKEEYVIAVVSCSEESKLTIYNDITIKRIIAS